MHSTKTGHSIKHWCVACQGSSNFFGSRQSYSYGKCTKCLTIQLNPLPSPEQLKDAYISDYAKAGHYYQDPEYSRVANKPFYEAVLRVLLKNEMPEGRVLDLGCGWGGLCSLLKQEGLGYIGVDLSEQEVHFCQAEGLNVIQGDLITFDSQYETFRAITMVAVLEHIVEHDQFMITIRKLLKPGGVLIILSPTSHFALVGGRLFQLITGRSELPELHHTFSPPWHTVLFSIDGLRSLMARHGMTLEKVIPAPSGRDKGIFRAVQMFATVIGRIGFIVIGEKWPILVSHIFLCRKKS